MNKSATPLIKHISRFLEYLEVEKGLSPVTSKNYHNFILVFISWLKDQNLSQIRPHELTTEHIWDYRLYLSRKTDDGHLIKKTTQSYYLIAVRALLNYFANQDIISLPAEKIKLPKLTEKDKKIKFLRIEQIEKLFAMPNLGSEAGLRDRAILELFFSTGMRVSELVSLNISLFDRNNLLAGKFSDLELSIPGKGGSVRTIYFSHRSLKCLADYLKTRNDLLTPLFINYNPSIDGQNERRLTTRSIERLVKRYAAMAGLPVEATPHTLRHSYATDLLEQGADLRSVQELLGHKNIVTTQIYTHVTNTQLKNIHRKFHSGSK
ncbi:MAG: tyrosine-type recombinase/integrase [Patescibacteria group bacterium]